MNKFDFYNKNILFFIKVAMLGGAERQALGLASYFKKEFNCNIILVATHSNIPTEEFSQFAKQCGITKIEYFGTPSLTFRKEFTLENFKKGIRALLYLNKLKKEIKKLQPDVIIPFLNTPSKIASLIFNSVGAKVTFWHQLGLDSYNYDLIEKKAIKKVPFVVANAANGLEVFKNKYNIKKEKLFVLPQYVSIEKKELDKNKIKKDFLIKEEAIVIGMVAHYRPEKYQDLLIDAFSKVKTTKDIHLVLLGNKDNDHSTLLKFNSLLHKVKERGITNKVSILSGYPVEKILNILDIGILVSEIEGTPNVVMEYMLYEIPVIATNHSGCANLLGDTPFLIPNNEQILIDRLQQLIESKTLRGLEIKRNSKQIKNFSIEKYVFDLQVIINKFI